MDTKIDFKNPEFYENRELSWIKFDNRVLSEARDKSIPLLERLKFVSITSSNLDEFFMVRVASLQDMVHANYKKRDIAGMTATEQLAAINKATRELVDTQYNTYTRSLVPLLNKEGIYLVRRAGAVRGSLLYGERLSGADTYGGGRIKTVSTHPQ